MDFGLIKKIDYYLKSNQIYEKNQEKCVWSGEIFTWLYLGGLGLLLLKI